MMAPARIWLPDSALNAGSVGGAVSPVIASWSQHWFPDCSAQVTAVGAAADAPDRQLEGVVSNAGQVCVFLPDNKKCRALKALIGLNTSEILLGNADQEVLNALLQEVVDDLAERIVGQIEPEHASVSDAWTEVVLSISGHAVFTIMMARSILIALIKGVMHAGSGSAALEHRAAAVRRAQIRVSACLGTAYLSLPEARSLEPGDIVILNRALDEPLELHAPGGTTPFASGRPLREADHNLSIQIEKTACP